MANPQANDASRRGDVVLHVRVVTGTGGGPDKTILASAATSDPPAKYPTAVAYMHRPDDPGFSVLERRAQTRGCRVLSIPDGGPLDPRPPRRLLQLCKRLNVRIWHGHDYKSNLFGLLLRPFHPMKLVTTAHGWVLRTRRTPLYYAVDRFCLRYYDHVISVSPDLHAQIHRLGVPPRRCSLLPNGVDEQVFRRRLSAEQSPLRHAQGVPRERLVVGAAGRLSGEKGFDHLIRAVHVLLRDGTDLELWIAGEGAARPDLQALIATLGLGDRVRLLGFVEDMVELFHSIDVFVVSSVREGLPNVLLEALAMGVPAVATRVAGMPAVITDGENGLLCEAGDVAALTASVRRLVVDRALRERLARAGRATIEERFTFAARMAREQEIYDEVLGGKSHPSRDRKGADTQGMR